MKRHSLGMLILLTASCLQGCTTICDEVIETEMGLRNKILAQKAWGHWSWCYDKLEHPYHFACGFKSGYQDVLAGGSGCQPTLPPQHYWKACYQTPEGRCKTMSWFDGFSHGALAAKQDGYGALGELPISPTARLNLEMARSKPVQQTIYTAPTSEDPVSIEIDGDNTLLSPPNASEESVLDPTVPATSKRPYE